MTRVVRLAMLLLIAMGAAAAQPQADKSKPNPAGTTNPPRSATNDPNYVIGPSDELTINVWKEADLSKVIPVRPDGKISLPLLNDIQAAGQTPMQLASAITEKLSKFVNNPQVTVIVTAINSQRVYVLGEVGRAGAYPMLPDMTVLQAISSAGGLSQFAKQKDIYVLRMDNGHQQRFPFDYKQVIRGQKTEENIVLKPGDTVVVP
jgi:polysaccharide export outer membrane protein